MAQDGSFTYTPTGTFTGRDTFSIQGCDDAQVPACAIGTVTVTVLPVAVDDAAVTSSGRRSRSIPGERHRRRRGPHDRRRAGSWDGIDRFDHLHAGRRVQRHGRGHLSGLQPERRNGCDDATLTVTVAPPVPPTDAGPTLATPLGPVPGAVGVLVGALTLIFLLSFGALVTRGRRRSSAADPTSRWQASLRAAGVRAAGRSFGSALRAGAARAAAQRPRLRGVDVVDGPHPRHPWICGTRLAARMTLDENRGDLERHARDFAARTGFTYMVLDPGDGDVVGCVYIYPLDDGPGARVNSWVRADHAAIDVPLAEAVAAWLARAWPFERVVYLGRSSLSR